MVNWEELCLIPTVLLLFVKIKSFVENATIEFKKKMAEYLNVVYKLAMLVSAKFLIGDADIWKVCWIAGLATFALLCYFMKLCVERKRDELTPTSQIVTLRINGRVWFSTLTRVLEVLLPLSYLGLAFAYYMELGPNNHPTENNWKTFASAMKICILVLTVLIPVMDIYHMCNTTDESDVQPDVDAVPSAVVKWGVKNQSLNANVAEALHIVVAHPPVVAIQIDDVEDRSDADGNGLEVALQMDAENRSAA